MMRKTVVRVNPPDMEEIISRLERLEQFERESRTSQMLLFWVEAHDCNFIVASPDVETACQIAATRRRNNNVEFLGRATVQYDKPQIIKWWNANNWDKGEGDD